MRTSKALLRIAILSRYQNTVSRGAETYVKELAEKLSKENIVDILSGQDADSFRKIIEGKYQIVISLNGGIQAMKASLGRLFSNYRLVIPGQAGIGRADIFKLLVKPDVYIALTDYMRDWARKWAWGSKVVKIPNGVDLDKFNPHGEKYAFKLDRPVILCVGALVWYKHHERVIEAVSKMDNGSLVIVGKGEKKKELQELLDKKLPARSKIISASYDELPKIYRDADIFTLPSWDREAFGIVYIEAMASGLAVVAPDDSSRREIVGEAGIFVDVTDSEKYAESLEKCLNTDWHDKLQKQAEKFSWNKIAKKYKYLFEKLK